MYRLPRFALQPGGLVLVTLLLSACAHSPPSSDPGGADRSLMTGREAEPIAALAGPLTEGWQPQKLPGKAPTVYRWVNKDGRPAIKADARQSASLWRRRLDPGLPLPESVRFSWWVESLLPQASVADAQREDAAARVVFGFDGDRSRLSSRNRALFDLAQTLTGEEPPYATLMYVWDSALPVGTVVVNPRSDRIRKIVVDSGSQQLRRWRDHERDLVADFRRAFGEDPGPLLSVALMSDTDNTRSRVRTWYGPVEGLRAEPATR